MTLELWLVFAGMMAVTYVPRVLPIMALSRVNLPPALVRFLRFVPPAVLSALLAQELFVAGGQVTIDWRHPFVLASAPTLIVALRTRNLMLTAVVGVLATAALRRFL